MTSTRREGAYNPYIAQVLTQDQLVEVVVGRIKPDYSLFFETEDPCLVMLDENDQPVLWANGLRKIPFRFDDEEMFQIFCGNVVHETWLQRERRPQPSELAYIPPERLCRFRNISYGD